MAAKQLQETLDFARVVEGTGIRALAIHARRVPERRRDNPHWDEVASIVSANLSIPVIHNSDVYTYADILRAKEVTGAFAYVILSFHVYFQVPVPVHSTGHLEPSKRCSRKFRGELSNDCKRSFGQRVNLPT